MRLTVGTGILLWGMSTATAAPALDNGRGASSACSAAVEPGPAPLRRLTRWEYDNTIRDLLGDTSRPASRFVAEETALGFDNQAQALVVSPLLAEQYLRAAERLAAGAGSRWRTLVPCDPKEIGAPACARWFVADFGGRAYRRALKVEEQRRLERLFLRAAGAGEFAAGVEAVVAAVLQSPAFLYRDDVTDAPGSPVPVPLTGWERATRLSYLLWGTMPDERLRQAAAAGQLGSARGVELAARRMLEDPRARPQVAQVHRQWLKLDAVERVDKNRKVFPGFTLELAAQLREETERFIDWVVWDGPGTLRALLTSSETFLNGPLAAFYGVPGVEGPAFRRVRLDSQRRAGLVTHPSLLVALSKPDQTSPILRGQFVREKLLCEHLPDPPPNVDANPPKPSPHLSTRERFEEHTNDFGCARCHRLIDGIGFGLESFDGVGRFRATENGKPVDTSGEIEGSDVPGAFNGPVQLAQRLAESAQVRSCFVRQWFRFAHGRAETPQDTCTLQRLEQTFERSGGNVRELLVALTQTDAFLYRPAARRWSRNDDE